LAWIAKKSPVYGKASVTVDGVPVGEVDLYSATTLWKQPVWNTGTLLSGTHIVTFTHTGTKSAAATDFNIGLDAIDVVGTLSQAPKPVRYQQWDSHLYYAGLWKNSFSSSASAGSFRFANSAGSSVTISFSRTYLAWIAKTSPAYGKAQVSVDGAVVGEVDLYSATTKYQQVVWNTGFLTEGSHTVIIRWLGTKRSQSSGTNIGLDAVDVIGMLG
jgi:hypothetical protein